MRATRARGWLGVVVLGTGVFAACSSDPAPTFTDSGDGSGGASSGGASTSGGAGTGGRGAGGAGTGGRATGGAGSGGRASGGGGGASGGATGTGGAETGGAQGDGGTGGAGTGGSGGQDASVDASPDAEDAGVEASPCGACDSGACLPDGGCVECVVDRDCKGALTHCSPAHVCVQCLPGASDDCADGTYCDADYTCKPGCKTSANCAPGICTPARTCTECDPSGADTCAAGKYCAADGACLAGCKADGAGCASGVCSPAHECVSCIADAECQSPRTCATGTCMAACSLAADCVGSGTADCCGGKCAFVSRDHENCLGCGLACAPTQFCGTAGCLHGTISNVCSSATATFLLDGLSVDDQLAPVVSAGLVAGCPTAVTARSLPQTTAGTINGVTGQPVVGSGDMQVVIGGPYGQSLIRYMDAQGITDVFNASDSQRARFQLRAGGPGAFVVDEPQSVVTPGHDYFLVEAVVDPATGTLMFAIHGFQAGGTLAGTWHFLNTMLPARASYDKSYYVYEWTDADADPEASAGDTYTLVASGP